MCLLHTVKSNIGLYSEKSLNFVVANARIPCAVGNSEQLNADGREKAGSCC
jgi:hypothetical protein